MSSALMKRLPRELKALQDKGVYKISLHCDNMCWWKVVVSAPQETPYAGGRFLLDVTIPETYPHAPPQIRFVTPIFNPSVDSDGKLCERLFEGWQPSQTIEQALVLACSVFSDWFVATVNEEAAKLAAESPSDFVARAKAETKRCGNAS